MSEETTNYGADQIQILEGLEAVRRRPGMYIGTTASRGLHLPFCMQEENSAVEDIRSRGDCTGLVHLS